MLSDRQLKLINDLPAEGSLFYREQGSQIEYEPSDLIFPVGFPLSGKKAEASKRAIILHGAPGSGKSYTGLRHLDEQHGKKNNFAIISYDESGAIYDISEYVDKLQEIAPEFKGEHSPLSHERGHSTWAAREQLWLDFQPLSQHIRSLTLKEALRRELSLFIDTTSSSMGAIELIKTLRDLDYTDIQILSVHAGLGQAADRIIERLRPTSVNDLLVKRVGAYEMLPHLISAADGVTMLYNPDNNNAAVEIARFDAGRLSSMNPAVLKSLTDQLSADTELFNEAAALYLPDNKLLPGRYAKTVNQFREGMEKLDPHSRTSQTEYVSRIVTGLIPR